MTSDHPQQKRSTKDILDLLDATLQSTTPKNFGMPAGTTDRCVACQMATPAPGSDWCFHCKPSRLGDPLPEADPQILGREGEDDDEPPVFNALGWVALQVDEDGNPVFVNEAGEVVAVPGSISVLTRDDEPMAIVLRDDDGNILGYGIGESMMAVTFGPILETVVERMSAFFAAQEDDDGGH